MEPAAAAGNELVMKVSNISASQSFCFGETESNEEPGESGDLLSSSRSRNRLCVAALTPLSQYRCSSSLSPPQWLRADFSSQKINKWSRSFFFFAPILPSFWSLLGLAVPPSVFVHFDGLVSQLFGVGRSEPHKSRACCTDPAVRFSILFAPVTHSRVSACVLNHLFDRAPPASKSHPAGNVLLSTIFRFAGPWNVRRRLVGQLQQPQRLHLCVLL